MSVFCVTALPRVIAKHAAITSINARMTQKAGKPQKPLEIGVN